jgi:hypothetical protein
MPAGWRWPTPRRLSATMAPRPVVEARDRECEVILRDETTHVGPDACALTTRRAHRRAHDGQERVMGMVFTGRPSSNGF